MTKEQTKEAIKVMQAALNGETIERRVKGFGNWGPMPENASWDWAANEYRIKPEVEYRPFESADEVMEAIKTHGDWVKNRFSERYVKLLEISANTTWAGCYATKETMQGYLYDEAFNAYTFADGTPFGKLVEE